MSERYLVELEFKRIGDFGLDMVDAKMRKAERGLASFRRGWSDLGSAISPLGGMVDSVASKVGSLAKMGVMVGGGALLAGATWGVTSLNNELEKATIGLGVIFNASGVASSVPKGLERAQQVVAQMRVDAQKLPGEFADLQNIFTTAATPAFRSGATIDQLRELSAKAMVAGKVTNMDLHQVAREFTLLLEGRAGSHNTFGSKMGLTGAESKKFNAMEADKRFDALSKLLSKYESGLTMFEASFDAQSSTLTDNVKDFVKTATGPLFEDVKGTMGEMNEWFKTNKQEISEYATTIGYALSDAFNEGKRIVKEYGPLLLDFVETSYRRLQVFWSDFAEIGRKTSSSVKDASAAIHDALSDPNGTIDKLLELGKIWLALKGAGMLVNGVQAGVGAAQGIGGMMSSAGLIGGGAAAGGAAGGASALAIAGAGAAFIAAVGGITAAIYQWNELEKERDDEHRKNMRAKAEAGEREIMEMVARQATEAEIQGRMNEMSEQFMARGQNLAQEFFEVAMAAQAASGALFGFSRADPGGKDSFWGNPSHDAPAKNVPFWLLGGNMNNAAMPAVKEPEKSPDAHKSKGGHGGTIQKVEIVVTSNQHPSRIARAVLGELGKVSRMNGRSPHVTNYSAIRSDG